MVLQIPMIHNLLRAASFWIVSITLRLAPGWDRLGLRAQAEERHDLGQVPSCITGVLLLTAALPEESADTGSRVKNGGRHVAEDAGNEQGLWFQEGRDSNSKLAETIRKRLDIELTGKRVFKGDFHRVRLTRPFLRCELVTDQTPHPHPVGVVDGDGHCSENVQETCDQQQWDDDVVRHGKGASMAKGGCDLARTTPPNTPRRSPVPKVRR